MQYKTVIHSPAIRIKNLKRPAEAEDYLTDLLNSHAAQGWNLHSIKEFYLTKKKDAAAINTASMSYIIIFYREGVPTFRQFNVQSPNKPPKRKSLFGLFGGKKSKQEKEEREEQD